MRETLKQAYHWYAAVAERHVLNKQEYQRLAQDGTLPAHHTAYWHQRLTYASKEAHQYRMKAKEIRELLERMGVKP